MLSHTYYNWHIVIHRNYIIALLSFIEIKFFNIDFYLLKVYYFFLTINLKIKPIWIHYTNIYFPFIKLLIKIFKYITKLDTTCIVVCNIVYVSESY